MPTGFKIEMLLMNRGISLASNLKVILRKTLRKNLYFGFSGAKQTAGDVAYLRSASNL
jgi:hypothetical protein